MSINFVQERDRDIDAVTVSCGSWRCCWGQGGEGSRGFSLLELVIAMAIGLIVLGAVYSVFTLQSKQFANQEVMVEMQQNARMAMDIITRELRMAGYDPSHALTKCSGTMEPSSPSTTCIGIRKAEDDTVSFAADLNGNGSLMADNTNPHENITYDRYWSSSSDAYALGRKSNGTKQPSIDNLDFLRFSYSDAGGNPATDLANIRKIKVTIRVKAAKADPSYTANSGFRTYTLISTITPRNLAY